MHVSHCLVLLPFSYQDSIQDVIKILWISQIEGNVMKNISSNNTE